MTQDNSPDDKTAVYHDYKPDDNDDEHPDDNADQPRFHLK
jgi:hypothetical protein